jgi:hypothetical protein
MEYAWGSAIALDQSRDTQAEVRTNFRLKIIIVAATEGLLKEIGIYI